MKALIKKECEMTVILTGNAVPGAKGADKVLVF